MSKTVKITRVEDLREGDHVTLVWNGDNDATTVSGVVRLAVTVPPHVRLEVGGVPFWLGDGPNDWHVTVAWRVVPDAPPLPTEPGSVIVKATIRGVGGQTAILDPEGDWFTTTCVEDYWYHDPEHITAWEPARIVPEGQS